MKTKALVSFVILCGMLSCETKTDGGEKQSTKESASTISNSKETINMEGWVELSHPGGPKAPKDLLDKLAASTQKKFERKQEFRTKHKKDGLPQFTNRLVLESSPYLQQHAHNPVNWHSWGDEAFELAAKTGKPVFLSIGYSTCHWCHVMEEESFEDLEIAKYLNENYIAIKVDREERPDIDDIYMKAVTIFRGQGGWPMSVWLTDSRMPFDGGTYFPARRGDRGSGIGFLELLKNNRAAYGEAETIAKAKRVTETIEKDLVIQSPPNARLKKRNRPLLSAQSQLLHGFDWENGGWGRTKFPMPNRLRFLLRYYRRSGEKPDVLIHTLNAMAEGGINDQVGGGFHRYTVDPKWTVPHFEKMLYDNAQLALLYTEAFQFSGDERYKRIAIETLDYLEREMLDTSGAFFAATDADSGGEEGTFFVWSEKEFESLLGEESKLASYYFGLSRAGNFEGKNVLTRRRHKETLEKFSIKEEELEKRIKKIREVLYEARKLRVAPGRDDKIISAWNALASEAFAMAGFVFSEPRFTKRSAAILNALEDNLFEGGTLYRSGISTDDGFKKGPIGVAEDYAFTIHASLKLFQYTGELRWFSFAKKLQSIFDENFSNSRGSYFRRSKKAPPALVREDAWKDGAIPSGNAYAAMNALMWKRISSAPEWAKRSDEIFGAYSGELKGNPLLSPTMLVALDDYGDKAKEVFVVGKSNEAMVEKLRSFHPNTTFFIEENLPRAAKIKAVPWLEKKKPKKGKATAYVCHQFICKLPTSDPKEFSEQLNSLEKL